jgi:hypothetical protein
MGKEKGGNQAPSPPMSFSGGSGVQVNCGEVDTEEVHALYVQCKLSGNGRVSRGVITVM